MSSDMRALQDEAIQFTDNPEIVIVDVRGVQFKVHRNLIIENSGYFRENLMNRYGFGDVRWDLPDAWAPEPQDFNTYVNWLYSRQLATKETPPTAGVPGHRAENSKYIRLARLHVVGHQLRDEHFQDVTLDAILAKVEELAEGQGRYHRLPGELTIFEFWEELRTWRGRSLLGDIYARIAGDGDINALGEGVPSRFWKDLVKRMAGLRAPDYVPDQIVKCKFHAHADPECRSNKRRRRT